MLNRNVLTTIVWIDIERIALTFESRLQALMVPKRFPEHHYRPKNEHLNKWTNSAVTRGEAKTWQT